MILYFMIREADLAPVCCGRFSPKHFDFPNMRKMLESKYPGAKIISPMEPYESDAVPVTCWLSPYRDGQGRLDSKPTMWLVRR